MKVLVVGAGMAAKKVAIEIRTDKSLNIKIVGFVDDDESKLGTKIGNESIIGTINDIPRLIKEEDIHQLLVAMPSAGMIVPRLTKLVPVGFPIKILPSISSVMLGKVDLSNIRDVDFPDLIGRSIVKADQLRIAAQAKGKSFLVTGGPGSIGSEIVRQLYSAGAARVVVLDQWEEGIFNLLSEFKNHQDIGSTEVVGRIGSIRDRARLKEVFEEFHFDALFHAAAYKHVPLMEENASEAKKTNVLGTENVIKQTIKSKIKEFVLISSDKAVNPANVMGRTKRTAELLMQKYASNYPKTRFCAVRFGNVLNSSGSLVPIVLEQIRTRRPVTITHRDMTRYFMTIPEAVSLVLSSWVVGKTGQILMLDMGEPVKIFDLIHSIIRVHGLLPGQDIQIIETGIRPGEKIHEELTYNPQGLRSSSVPRVFIAEELPKKPHKRRVGVRVKAQK